ncbi:MAG: pilin [Steroidobacteraceae bacterium]
MLAFSYLVVPMYASALYYRRIRRRIEKMRRRVPESAARVAALEKGPHTNPIIFWVLVPFLVVVPSMLAAIAIPAYQQYAIRSQVFEGLTLARPLERAAVRRYSIARQWPADLSDLGIARPPSGKYVASIQLDRGTLSITFGSRAARLISGGILSLRPTIVAAGRVLWTCGYALPPNGTPQLDTAGPQRTTIAVRYLPQVCRRKSAP